MTTPTTVTRRYGALDVTVHPDATALGRAAAADASAILQAAIARDGWANLIVATGNSQLTFFAALRERDDVDWSRVRLFHLDEYLGLAEDHRAGFRRFARREIVEPLSPAAFYGIEGDAADPQRTIDGYRALLERYPADLCCMGIGENGHLAFNDPPDASFDDPAPLRIVTLDEASRRQQVGEGHFASLDEVPERAITLTIPTLLSAARVLVMVPETRKADAVRAALEGPVSEACPASILQRTPHAHLHLDRDAASRLAPG